MNQVDNAAQVALYGGAGTTGALVWLGLSPNEWAALLSAGIAVVGGFVHIWILLQRHKREREEHEQRMEDLRAEKDRPEGAD